LLFVGKHGRYANCRREESIVHAERAAQVTDSPTGGREVIDEVHAMTTRERLRTKLLEALQHPRVTAAIANPRVVRWTMAAVAAQARIDGLEARWTRAIAHAFNLPTREEHVALKATIQRLETRLHALEERDDR
jgi:hypothetical protein